MAHVPVDQVWEWLDAVPDPEIPVISVVDLGIVRSVEWDEDTLEVAEGKAAVALRFSVSEPDKAVGLRHDREGRDVVEALAELPDLWDVNISGWSEDSCTARFSEEGFQLPYTRRLEPAPGVLLSNPLSACEMEMSFPFLMA